MRLIHGLLAAALAASPAQAMTFQIGTPCDGTWDVGQIEIRDEVLLFDELGVCVIEDGWRENNRGEMVAALTESWMNGERLEDMDAWYTWLSRESLTFTMGDYIRHEIGWHCHPRETTT